MHKKISKVQYKVRGVLMTEIEQLLKDIDELRKNLEILIERKKGDLLDKDVQYSSRILNVAIAEYNEMLQTKIKDTKK